MEPSALSTLEKVMASSVSFSPKMWLYNSLSTTVVWWFSHSVVSDSFHPHDGSLPGSSAHEISQARILEGVAISFSSLPSLLCFLHWVLWEALFQL